MNTALRHRCIRLVLTTSILAPAIVGAQGPWTVTVTPTVDPLPIGFCGAVRLGITETATGATARNPAGYLISLTDFDMTVTAPGGSVVGQWIDASHWSVCACQGGAVGTVATITATYPARALAANVVVKGAKASANFATAKPKGEMNPPACQSGAVRPLAQAGPPPVPLSSGVKLAIAKTPATPVGKLVPDA